MKKKVNKEVSEFKVQREYENSFKTQYQKMLLMMNKTIILKLTTQTNANNG